MRARHKTPTLVSMWMLDVFCCALGCVIMLWVLESLSSSEQSRKAKNALQDLGKSRTELISTRSDLDSTKKQLNSEIEDLRGQLAAMLAEKDAKELALVKANTDIANTKKALALATTDLDDQKKKLLTQGDTLQATKDDLAKAADRVMALIEEMKKKDKAASTITADLAATRTNEMSLQKLLREQEQMVAALETAKKKADQSLNDLDAKYRNLEKDAKELSASRTMASKAEEELASTRKTMSDLKKQLDDSNASIIDLQGEKKKLADKFDKLDTDSRFAGIAMTGKRVVFMVDISGSMKLIDEKTPDVNKWPTVVETVSKVMRSIPDLEKFQVIVFSRSSKYLFESGDWQTYKGEDSVKLVARELKDTVVGSDTNLYSAFDLAFKLRSSGLDTVYLFSDGLPTSGPGVTVEQDKFFNDNQRVEALAKHLRNTLKTDWNSGARKVKINSVGFFYESPEVGAFLWALSRENDGSFVGMSKP
jgi:myosin heavy subunit